MQPVLERLFGMVDTDKTGHIDLREFAIGLCNAGNEAKGNKVKFAFQVFDLDGSGCTPCGGQRPRPGAGAVRGPVGPRGARGGRGPGGFRGRAARAPSGGAPGRGGPLTHPVSCCAAGAAARAAIMRLGLFF